MSGSSLECCELFAQAIRSCKCDAEALQAVFNETPGIEVDKKSILEQAFRDVLSDKIKSVKSSRMDGADKACFAGKLFG